MKVVTKIFLVLSFMFGGLTLAMPSVSFASEPCNYVVNEKGEWIPEGGGTAVTTVPDACKKAADDLIGKILRFVSILSMLAVVAAVAMIIYAGFKYITSQGDPKQTESAKQQLWYSGVGLFIVLTAFTILKLFQTASGFGS